MFLDNIKTKTFLRKKNMGQNCFKERSKFQKFQFDLVRRGKGENRMARHALLKGNFNKNKNFGQIYLKKHLN